MSELGEFLGKSSATQNEMKQEYSREDSIGTWFLFPETQLQIRGIDYTYSREDIDGFILAGSSMTYPIPASTIDDMDSTTGWTKTWDGTISLNNTTYHEGTGAINAYKSATTLTKFGLHRQFVTGFDLTDRYFTFYLYIDDQATLDKLATTSALVIRIGNVNTANRYNKHFNKEDLAIGWNQMTVKFEDCFISGTPDRSILTYFYLSPDCNNASDTIAEGKIIFDLLQSEPEKPIIWYSVLGTTGVGLGNRGTGYTDSDTNNLFRSITTESKNEVRDWLGNIGTARYIGTMSLSDGTAAYSVSSTAMPSTVISRRAIGTIVRTGTSQEYHSEFNYCSFGGTALISSIGLESADSNITYLFYNLGTQINAGTTYNHKFSITTKVEDDSLGDGFWTNVGTTRVADWMGGTTVTSPTDIAWGTGTTDILQTDTALEGELLRKTITDNSIPSDYQNEWYSIFGADEGTGTIRKIGLFNAGTATGGDMFIEHQTFPIVKKPTFQLDTYLRNTII